MSSWGQRGGRGVASRRRKWTHATISKASLFHQSAKMVWKLRSSNVDFSEANMGTKEICILVIAFALFQADSALSQSITEKTPPPPTARKAVVSALKSGTPGSPLANQYKTAAGFWQETDDEGSVGAWFYFTEKDGVFQGRLARLFKKAGEPSHSNRCEKCEGDQKDPRCWVSRSSRA
jgi:hypothetical protein